VIQHAPSARPATFVPFFLVALAATLPASPSSNDFFQFWWAGHLVVTGRSPYDPAAWSAALAYGPAAGAVARNCVPPAAPACLWLYPPWTAWLFAPTGALDPPAGIAVQRVVLASALAVGGALWARIASVTAAAPLLVAFAASAPFVRDILTGHFEGLLVIGLGLVAIGLRDRASWPLVAGALLLSFKPHLFIALAPLLLVWLIRARAYRTIALAAAGLFVLAIVAFASDPLAWPALVGRSAGKTEIAGATTWALAMTIGGGAWLAVAALVLAVGAACVAVVWRSRRSDRGSALVAVGAAFSLALAPYLQSYDLVLLFPAVAIAFARSGGAMVVVAAIVVAATWLAYWLELSGTSLALVGALPTIALVVLALRVRAAGAARLDPA